MFCHSAHSRMKQVSKKRMLHFTLIKVSDYNKKMRSVVRSHIVAYTNCVQNLIVK